MAIIRNTIDNIVICLKKVLFKYFKVEIIKYLIFIFLINTIMTSCYKDIEPEILETHFFAGDIDPNNDYGAIPTTQKKVVYFENFNFGNAGWGLINNDGFVTKFLTSKFIVENSRNDLIRWVNRNTSLSSLPNFEIECNIKVFNTQGRGGGIGLSNGNNDLFSFIINDKQELSCFHVDKTKNETIRYLERNPSIDISESDWNKVTIRRYNGKYYVFMNQKNTYIKPITLDFTFDKLSFVIAGAGRVEINDITLYSIE